VNQSTTINSLRFRGEEVCHRKIATISFGHPLTATCDDGMFRPAGELENREKEQKIKVKRGHRRQHNISDSPNDRSLN
jgi:hypothetical protein